MKYILVVTGLTALGLSAGYGFSTIKQNESAREEETISETETEESQIGEEAVRNDAPFFMTTMTHMEGDHIDDKDETAFWNHVEQIRYGMDLADEYGATLTFESEKPFARANTVWGLNMMKEIMERGHGVGTHCDLGGPDLNNTLEELIEKNIENKTLVDDLVGEENNLGCSGNGGVADWALAMTEAGFKYIDGIVGFHYLAMPEKNRPEGWTNAYILNGAFHDNAPVDLEDRIYPRMLANAIDFEADEDGTLLMSAGSLGRLDAFEEGGRDACTMDRCDLTKEDVDLLVQQIIEIDEFRDRSQIAKVDVYFPVHNWDPENEEGLRYFFEEMQRLEEEGVIQWASQREVYEAFLEWQTGTEETNNDEKKL